MAADLHRADPHCDHHSVLHPLGAGGDWETCLVRRGLRAVGHRVHSDGHSRLRHAEHHDRQSAGAQHPALRQPGVLRGGRADLRRCAAHPYQRKCGHERQPGHCHAVHFQRPDHGTPVHQLQGAQL